MTDLKNKTYAVILAGGRGTRMGSPTKPLLKLGNKAIIGHICDSIRPHVQGIIISANTHHELYKEYADTIVSDEQRYQQHCPGPLLGILEALRYLEQYQPDAAYLACFPGDAPLFPEDLLRQLQASLTTDSADIAWVENDGQPQPLFSLWKTSLTRSLELAISQGQFSPMAFIREQNNTLIKLSHCARGDFDNLNRPQDLENARNLMSIKQGAKQRT